MAASLDREIRKASLDLFASQGFEAVTVDAIAAHTGVSKATLYARFPGKPELLRAIIEAEIEEWGERAAATVGPLPHDLRDRLKVHARMMITSGSWKEIRRMERLITEISGTFPELAAAYLDAGQRKFLSYLAEDIAQFLPDRATRARRAEVIAAVLLHAITGWHRSESLKRTVTEQEAVEFADEVILALMANLDPVSDRPV